MIQQYAKDRSNLQSPFLDEFVMGQLFRNYSIRFYQKISNNQQAESLLMKKKLHANEADVLRTRLQITSTQLKRAKNSMLISKQLQLEAQEKERSPSSQYLRTSTSVSKKSFLWPFS